MAMKHRGFILLEVMLGVAIFAIGILALGRCVSNCVAAETARQEMDRARLALENRMAQIEAGQVPTTKDLSDPLDGAFTGMTLKQTRTRVAAKNEKGLPLANLYKVNLELDWMSGNEPESRTLFFYVMRQ